MCSSSWSDFRGERRARCFQRTDASLRLTELRAETANLLSLACQTLDERTRGGLEQGLDIGQVQASSRRGGWTVHGLSRRADRNSVIEHIAIDDVGAVDE